MVIGITISIFVTMLEVSNSPVKFIAQGYSALIRALPDILVIFGINYFVLDIGSHYFHIYNIGPFITGCMALSLIVSAFSSQILLYAYNSISKNQLQAAKSLGLNKFSLLHKIILPQVIKQSLPMMINLFLVILKDSSIVSLIGLNDMMNVAHIAASESLNAFDYYGFTGLVYLALSFVVLLIQKSIKNYNEKGGNYVNATI
jgi:ABC-type arginine transport system permease subunit